MKPIKSFIIILCIALFPLAAFGQEKAPPPPDPSKQLMENILKTTNDALNATKDNAPVIADRIMKESSQVVDEYLKWHMVKNGMVLFRCFLAFLIAFIIFKFFREYWNKELADGHPRAVISLFAMIIVCVVGTIYFLCKGISAIEHIIQIYMSPRVFLIENIIQLLK